MGPTHAMSGAAAWVVAAPAVAALTGSPPVGAPELLVGAGVCAGAALLPDIDSPQSTVARSFGPVTEVLSHTINAVSAGVRNATGTRKDGHVTDGHRTLTHTLLCAAAAGAGVSALVAAFGRPSTVAVLFFTLGLAVRGLMGSWAKKEGWLGVTGVSAVGAYAAYETLSDGRLWWLGAAVTAGMVLHGLGDALTKEGVPFIAPLRWRGKGWWEFSTGPLSFRAGGLVEYALVAPLLTATTVLGVIHAIDPALYGTLTGTG